MAKITINDYKKFKDEGLSDAEIARRVEISQATLSYHRKKWFQTPNETATAEIKPIESKSTQEDKTAENEGETTSLSYRIDSFKKQITEQNYYILDLQAKVAELENVHAACEDIENELASLREENEMLKKAKYHNDYMSQINQNDWDAIIKENQELKEELIALRLLARRYLAVV